MALTDAGCALSRALRPSYSRAIPKNVAISRNAPQFGADRRALEAQAGAGEVARTHGRRVAALRSMRTLFTGGYPLKVDAKGRIAAPAEYRRALDLETFNGFWCTPSLTEPALECGGPDYIEDLFAMIDALDPFDPDRAALTEALIGQARAIPFDGDGRFILPQAFRDHAQIEDRATLIGVGEKFLIRRGKEGETVRPATLDQARGALPKLKRQKRAAS